MGGVDQIDNHISNYRIALRGKMVHTNNDLVVRFMASQTHEYWLANMRLLKTI